MNIEKADIIQAIAAARKGRSKRKDFCYTKDDADAFAAAIADGTYTQHIAYRKLKKRNSNGKVRDILQPNNYTLVLQHLCKILLQPYYAPHDNNVGLNCKLGHGITAKQRANSVVKRIKHVYYDLRQYSYALIIDQRQCYAHITIKTARRALKRIGVPRWLNDYAISVCFYKKQFPIGVPTSPLVHHIVMVESDKLAKSLSPHTVRYADDNFVPMRTKEDAQRALWRVKNLWWYTLQIRAKRQSVRIVPLSAPSDFCGNVFHRNENKCITDHNKGYTLVRASIVERARRCTNKNYPSYFGLIKVTDGFNLLLKLEQDLKLSALTEKIRISRSKLDAPEIEVKELCDTKRVFDIEGYEVRYDKDGTANWMHCLISFQNKGADRRETRSISGGYVTLAAYLDALQKSYAKEDLLPIEDCIIDKLNGYYLRGSLEMIVAKLKNGQYITNSNNTIV
jgi:hypothetical protein